MTKTIFIDKAGQRIGVSYARGIPKTFNGLSTTVASEWTLQHLLMQEGVPPDLCGQAVNEFLKDGNAVVDF